MQPINRVMELVMKRYCIVAIFALVLLAGLPVRSTTAAEAICFNGVPGINDCISGRFREYWEQNGGLAVFGYPLTPAQRETTAAGTFLVQYFERQRFELHPENAAPYDVLLGLLGAEIYGSRVGDWRADPVQGLKPSCRYFAETRRNLCEPFLAYWEGHGLLDGALDAYGRSLMLLGLPLTEPHVEINPDGDTVMTQWFERARLEDHGTKGVLLGRLGAELRLGSPGANPGSSADAQAVLAAINQERAQRNIDPLTLNPLLSQAAQVHSDDMASNDFFSHTGSDGSNAGVRIARTGYQARGWAENIAAGYPSAAAVVAGWMQSDGHRRNILNPLFTEIGIGRADNPNTTYGIYWTNVFGTR